MNSLVRTLNNQFLSLSEGALSSGNVVTSRNLAEEALLRALQEGDSHYEARALLLLARADVVASRMQRARESSSAAAQRFEEHGDTLSQSVALAIHSYASSALGLEDEARMTAGRALLLQEDMTLEQGPSLALNYVGVASFWAKDYSRSDSVLEASTMLAQASSTPDAGFQPLLNRSFAEMLRLHSLAQEEGVSEADPTRLVTLLQRTMDAAKSAQPHHADAVTATTAFVLMHFVSAMAMTHCHDLKAAYEHLSACKERLQGLPSESWMHALVPWVEVEIFRLKEEPRKALLAAQRMMMAARRGEHAPVLAIARLLDANLRPRLPG